jgi:hypothetical protein
MRRVEIYSTGLKWTSTFKAYSVVDVNIYSAVFINIDIYCIIDVNEYSAVNVDDAVKLEVYGKKDQKTKKNENGSTTEMVS